MSGDIAAVPPKAATIGPAQIIGAKFRMEQHDLTIHGTSTSWQRLITRLCLHGPVTPKLPTSIHQLLKTDCYVTETAARDIEPDWDKGY
jgi:glucosamine-6-phosphate deaminase